AREVIKADLEQPGEEDVFRKIRKDFDAKGLALSDHQIRRKMSELMGEALAQIEAEAKS
ncbi:ATPase inhibitor subunit zeta, partial [Methyloceanibacter sp.]|uniref:ATPase inhibitor subunit zeta n=1 Tax=Methyloceanibacter sp. TaxID=1965321 RepID=UPI002D3A711F